MSTIFAKKSGATALLSALLVLQMMPSAQAAQTDIANAPLFTSSVSSVKSNIMFIMDNSGSMGWDYLPDDAPRSTTGYGFYASQCNGVAYNPKVNYLVPIKADGISHYPAATFASAKDDGFSTSSTSTTDLTNRYYYTYTGSQPAMSYSYSASGSLDKNSTFYKECVSSQGSTPGSGVFTKVTVTGSSSDAQNYANWYTYYGTRMQMMKSSVGLAFSSVDSKYRVGFKIIGDTSTSGSNFLDIKDFDAAQKTLFYSKLYVTQPSGSTPLRGALSQAGLYFANMAPGQSSDPVQYSCQKNFSILSTDGYWNDNSESSGYGPLNLGKANVGQQDGSGTERPMFDGSTPQVITTNNNSLTRCASGAFSPVCKITVGTSSSMNYAAGNQVTISGASPNVYNGL